jgi:hypothetical protein
LRVLELIKTRIIEADLLPALKVEAFSCNSYKFLLKAERGA